MAELAGKRRPARDLAERLGLPAEALGQLRLTVVGQSRLLAENHRGILDYGDSCIRLAAARGSVTILGGDLRLRAMNPRELLITGQIRTLEWDG